MPVSVGDLLKVGKVVGWARGQIDVRQRQALVSATEKQLAVQEAELRALRDRDRVIRESRTRGISIAAGEPVYGYWRDANEIKMRFYFTLRNEWMYLSTLEKLTGDVQFGQDSRSRYKLPSYDDEATIPIFGPNIIRIIHYWSPSPSEQGQFFPNPDHLSLVRASVDLRAYVSQGGTRFQVEASLIPVEVIVYPVGTSEPQMGF